MVVRPIRPKFLRLSRGLDQRVVIKVSEGTRRYYFNSVYKTIQFQEDKNHNHYLPAHLSCQSLFQTPQILDLT